MAAASTTPPASSFAVAHDLPVAAAVEQGASAPDFVSTLHETASNAHRAVEAVLHAADRVSSREQSSVNLQFSVGGQDLSVRVEMRANEVHTTFRTDSSELRAALAQEWRNGNGERSTRLPTPVFTASDANNGSFSGDTASQQRDSGARRANHDFTAAPSVRSFSAGAASAEAPAAAARSRSANSIHLHTLA